MGYIPVAPATFSCVISVIIWYFLIQFKIIYIIITIVLFVLGIVLSDSLSRMWGKDPREVVIDEYACLLIPLYFTPIEIVPFVITFVFFRIFDILKPPPLRKIEKISGGWGVMLDDLGAAIYTSFVIIICKLIFKL